MAKNLELFKMEAVNFYSFYYKDVFQDVLDILIEEDKNLRYFTTPSFMETTTTVVGGSKSSLNNLQKKILKLGLKPKFKLGKRGSYYGQLAEIYKTKKVKHPKIIENSQEYDFFV